MSSFVTRSTRNISSMAVLFTGLATFSACSLSSDDPTAPGAPIRDEAVASMAYTEHSNVPSHGVALEGYCPVAYFAVNEPVRGSAEFASTHEGITYYLVSQDAKNAFDANPNKYVPAYGGWCAFGMAVEDKFPVDPTVFKIENGRLLVFLKNPTVDALELWNQGDNTELLAKADAHWAKIRG